MRAELIAPCHFGLEACTKAEIRALGYEITEVADGRVTFLGDERAICRSNLFLRTAERVLLCVGSFPAKTWDELFEGTRALPWENYLPKNARFYVAKASSIRSALFSPRDFQTIIQKAIVTRLDPLYHMNGRRFPMDGPDYALRVFAFHDRITITIDTSGDSLHKRGYRKLTAKAPITETLAAALLLLTPWKPDRILVDPFCGSGTFCIEAAMMAAKIAPGLKRSFAAAHWDGLIPKTLWHEAYDEAYDLAETVNRTALIRDTDLEGYDIDGEVLAAAKENARLAGVSDLIRFEKRDVAALTHKSPYGFLVTNPPYGERLSEKETLFALYKTLGERFRALPDWSLYLISSYEETEKALGGKAAKNRKIYNGMIRTYFYSYPGKKPERRS